MEEGDRVKVKADCGYFELYPVLNFRRAKNELHGILKAKMGCKYFITLNNGVDIQTSNFAVEIAQLKRRC